MANNRGRHDSDRACTGDQYVFAENRERKCRVNRIAEGIKYRGHIEVDVVRMAPDIRHWQDYVFSKSSGPVHSHSLRMGAKMPATGEAITAAPAGDVALAADQFAGM